MSRPGQVAGRAGQYQGRGSRVKNHHAHPDLRTDTFPALRKPAWFVHPPPPHTLNLCKYLFLCEYHEVTNPLQNVTTAICESLNVKEREAETIAVPEFSL